MSTSLASYVTLSCPTKRNIIKHKLSSQMQFCHQLFHAILSSFPPYLPNDLVLLFILLLC